ncbi:MAG TPA: alpha/beta hydrolase-fold protein [Opitutaceae bacterium]|jgi:enterochelin esterase-like enzyme
MVTVLAFILAAVPAGPIRLPDAPGTPPLTRIEGPGQNPPSDRDGDYLVGPNYLASPDYERKPGVPSGAIHRLVFKSEDSHFYPGITRVPPGSPASYFPHDWTQIRRYPKPWTRTIVVYVPAQYKSGTPAPILITQDGPDNRLPGLLDNLIAQGRLPAMAAIMIPNGGGDAQGSERGLEYDTVSAKYAEWIEAEVLPRVESECGIRVTRDPDGRATLGSSSGAAAALTMAWFHPEWYHRVVSYSGTFVNQAWPPDAATPHGAWEYHAHLIPDNPPKPIRIWMEVGDRDLLTRPDGYHDWVVANNRMAAVLKAKGYHHQYLFALNATHSDRAVREQTMPEALEWVWRGYQPSRR